MWGRWRSGGPTPAALEFAPVEGAELRLAERDDLTLHRTQPREFQRK